MQTKIVEMLRQFGNAPQCVCSIKFQQTMINDSSHAICKHNTKIDKTVEALLETFQDHILNVDKEKRYTDKGTYWSSECVYMCVFLN